MTAQEQYRDLLWVYVCIYWVEFLPSVKLQDGYMGLKMQPEPSSTKWRVARGWNYSFVWTIPSSQAEGKSAGSGEGSNVKTKKKKLSVVTSLIRAQFESVHITECGFMTSERCPLWRSVNAASVGENMMIIIILQLFLLSPH